jgi:hypothetical protein
MASEAHATEAIARVVVEALGLRIPDGTSVVRLLYREGAQAASAEQLQYLERMRGVAHAASAQWFLCTDMIVIALAAERRSLAEDADAEAFEQRDVVALGAFARHACFGSPAMLVRLSLRAHVAIGGVAERLRARAREDARDWLARLGAHVSHQGGARASPGPALDELFDRLAEGIACHAVDGPLVGLATEGAGHFVSTVYIEARVRDALARVWERVRAHAARCAAQMNALATIAQTGQRPERAHAWMDELTEVVACLSDEDDAMQLTGVRALAPSLREGEPALCAQRGIERWRNRYGVGALTFARRAAQQLERVAARAAPALPCGRVVRVPARASPALPRPSAVVLDGCWGLQPTHDVAHACLRRVDPPTALFVECAATVLELMAHGAIRPQALRSFAVEFVARNALDHAECAIQLAHACTRLHSVGVRYTLAVDEMLDRQSDLGRGVDRLMPHLSHISILELHQRLDPHNARHTRSVSARVRALVGERALARDDDWNVAADALALLRAPILRRRAALRLAPHERPNPLGDLLRTVRELAHRAPERTAPFVLREAALARAPPALRAALVQCARSGHATVRARYRADGRLCSIWMDACWLRRVLGA